MQNAKVVAKERRTLQRSGTAGPKSDSPPVPAMVACATAFSNLTTVNRRNVGNCPRFWTVALYRLRVNGKLRSEIRAQHQAEYTQKRATAVPEMPLAGESYRARAST